MKKYRDMQGILRQWERDRIFTSESVRHMLTDLRVYLHVRALLGEEGEGELWTHMQMVDTLKVLTVI